MARVDPTTNGSKGSKSPFAKPSRYGGSLRIKWRSVRIHNGKLDQRVEAMGGGIHFSKCREGSDGSKTVS